jgi:hypothetical protein
MSTKHLCCLKIVGGSESFAVLEFPSVVSILSTLDWNIEATSAQNVSKTAELAPN